MGMEFQFGKIRKIWKWTLLNTHVKTVMMIARAMSRT